MANPIIMSMEDLEGLAESPETPKVVGGGGESSQDAAVTPTSTAVVSPETEALRKALEISENARLSMQQQMQPQAVAQPTQQAKWYTDEELAEMASSDDPAARVLAMRASAQQQVALASQYFQGQMATLTQSMYGSAEADARRRYPKEFELYGPQISALAQRTEPGTLTSSAVWDNLISYIRGLPGNFEKFVDHQITTRTNARATQEQTSGFTAVAPIAPTPAASFSNIDPITREVASQLGYDKVEDYIKDMGLVNKFTLNG